jgi:hypothetical protein
MKEDIFGGFLTDAPNDNYRKFFDKFKEIESLDVSSWSVCHLLAYFCKKYYDTYNIKYKFKFNSTIPSKCFEVFQIKKLASILTSKPELLKEYIDWIYLNKVVKAKRRLTSISFMTVEGIVNEYKFNVLLNSKKNNVIERTTPLPQKYKNIFLSIGQEVNTYGDLAFLIQIKDMPTELINAFSNVKSLGLDLSILERVI